MRLKRLRLHHYGCFAALDLKLAAEPGCITLIAAPNGAGKSVLRQAFHDLLFDIPVQSPMKFRHGYPGMALHAEAEMADGAPFSFGWERGGKPPRVTSDAARFAALRGGVTPLQLESLFALDTTRLRKGGTDLKGGATLSEALLAGTGELASAKAVRDIIEKRRQENWGKAKSKPPLNAAAGRLDDTRRRLRGAVVRPEAREAEERGLAERQTALDAARTARAAAATDTSRLHRIALTRPHLLALEEAQAWLAAHPDAPALPPGLDQALATAREAAALAEARQQAAAQAATRAAAVVAGIVRDPFAGLLAERLATLSGQLGATDKAATDIVGLQARHAAELDGVRAALRAIGSDLPEHRAAELIPTVGLKAEILAAITDAARLGAALDLAQAAAEKARAALASAAGDIAAVAPLPDGLLALLGEIRADRSKPVAHAEQIAAAATAAAAELRRLLATQPGWTGTAEALRALTLPTDAAFERLEADRAAAIQAAQAAQAYRARLAAEDNEARAALAGLRAQPLPDTASVLAARADRDRGMRLVLARAFGVPPSPADEAGFAGDEPMKLAYERRVRDADALADRRATELERVQEAERLGRAIAAQSAPLHAAIAGEAAALATRQAAQNAWTAAIAPLGLGPRATIGELRQAGALRLAVVQALKEDEIAAEAQAALARQHLAWAERLAACLTHGPATLGALLAAADQAEAAARAAEQDMTLRQAVLDAATRAVPNSAAALAEAEAAMARWQALWAGLLRRLGRPPGESPEAVAATLAGIAELERRHREALALAGRVHDIEADLAGFAASVSALALQTGQAAEARPAETARRLLERAAAAATAEAAWLQARQTMGAAADAAAQADAALRDAQARLDAVIASCGAADAAAAEARIAASRAHADQLAHRNAALAKLIEHGDGLGAAALRHEAEAVPVEEMARHRQAADDAAAAAQAGAEAASVALHALQTSLALAADSTEAMEARADHEAAIASFDRLLEDQLVLHLAGAMLGDAMREVEGTSGGSALARISASFSAITDAAYALETHDGPAGEELFAIERAFPNERKALTELSEGTRDQLYLALRMEALRGHCQSAMPVPFIADDILQTFDDARAAAALRALCALSTSLQVIVLTHHAHLRDVAATLAPGSVQLVSL